MFIIFTEVNRFGTNNPMYNVINTCKSVQNLDSSIRLYCHYIDHMVNTNKIFIRASNLENELDSVKSLLC